MEIFTSIVDLCGKKEAKNAGVLQNAPSLKWKSLFSIVLYNKYPMQEPSGHH